MRIALVEVRWMRLLRKVTNFMLSPWYGGLQWYMGVHTARPAARLAAAELDEAIVVWLLIESLSERRRSVLGDFFWGNSRAAAVAAYEGPQKSE